MRRAFVIVFALLALALGVCAAVARRSGKGIGHSVALLLNALIPPVIGNAIIIASGDKLVSGIGCYVYFLGMDFVVYALLRFTMDYCGLSRPSPKLRAAVYALLALDAVQLLCNPLFGHAFDTEAILVEGFSYYRLVPCAGQTFHRVADYGVFAAVLVILLVRTVRSHRVYAERYSVMLITMLVVGLWQTFYIFSRTPVDRSMIGFAVFGLLVFYFSLYYRPLRLLDRMLANIASELPEALFFFDAAGRCIWANRPGTALAGVGSDEFDRAAERLKRWFDGIDTGGNWTDQRVSGEGDGARYYALERHTVTDERGRVAGSFLSVRDDTGARREYLREKYFATHDSLTGLYTRQYLYERVHALIHDNPGVTYLVVFIDVNDFKIVNDIFGKAFGDFALCRVAEWVGRDMSDDCVYGRLEGDTFGACLPANDFNPRRVEDALSKFVVRDGALEHHILIHMGVYEVTEPELDVSVMFDRAHIALTTIKQEYSRHIAYYDDAMRRRMLWEQHISTQLVNALSGGQIRPYLQPVVDRSGRVVGAEALVRWIHPTDGLLPPSAFISVFEKNGMIAEVDRHMWREACRILAGWRQKDIDAAISINISPKDFYFMDVAAEIRGVVREFGIDPSRLRLEITETVMMTDIENRVGILKELKAAGFTIAMDDFGSGYSSLNMLKDMPVDVLKIDMRFLTRSMDDGKAQTILRNILRMTGELDIMSLTEGVETEEQFDMLAAMGCKRFQGYYFAKPMPVEEFEAAYFRGRAEGGGSA